MYLFDLVFVSKIACHCDYNRYKVCKLQRVKVLCSTILAATDGSKHLWPGGSVPPLNPHTH